jgi:hypothetical protein
MARKETTNRLKELGLIRTGIFGDHKADPERFGVFTSLKEIKDRQFD